MTLFETRPPRLTWRDVRRLAAAVEALPRPWSAPPTVAALLPRAEHACLAVLWAAEPEPGRAQVVVRVLRSDTVRTRRDHHLRVLLPHPHPWPAVADVLVEGQAGDRPWREHADRARGLARARPGAQVVAAHGASRCVLRVRGDRTLRLTTESGGGAAWATWASLVHAWLVAGVPPAALAGSSAHLLRLPSGDDGARPSWDQTVALRPHP
jgi:hypothetical protein